MGKYVVSNANRNAKIFIKKSHTNALIKTEHQEAVALAGYLLLLQRLGKVELYSHIPHETYTPSFNQRRKNAQEGVRQGVPDYIIVTRTSILFIELKRTKGSQTSPEQLEWLARLSGKTAFTFLAKGFEQAKLFIDEHIS